MVTISVIIPTLNEEKYIGKLLNSLKRQTFRDFEVIISDSKSRDRTLKIAKKHGVKKIITGPKKGPGAGRNLGATAAEGKILLFCDADIVLEKDTLEIINRTMKNRNVVGGSCLTVPFDGNDFDKALFNIINQVRLLSTGSSSVMASGFFCFYRKELFKRLRGFNEKLAYCEDYDLAKRAAKHGRFVLLNKEIKMSVRRYKAKGYLCYVLPILYYNLTGTVPRDLFDLEPIRDVKQ